MAPPRTGGQKPLGANAVVYPAAHIKGSAVYGMPILKAYTAKTIIVNTRSMAAGYAGLDNEVFYRDKTVMVVGDAKKGVEDMVKAVFDQLLDVVQHQQGVAARQQAQQLLQGRCLAWRLAQRQQQRGHHCIDRARPARAGHQRHEGNQVEAAGGGRRRADAALRRQGLRHLPPAASAMAAGPEQTDQPMRMHIGQQLPGPRGGAIPVFVLYGH